MIVDTVCRFSYWNIEGGFTFVHPMNVNPKRRNKWFDILEIISWSTASRKKKKKLAQSMYHFIFVDRGATIKKSSFSCFIELSSCFLLDRAHSLSLALYVYGFHMAALSCIHNGCLTRWNRIEGRKKPTNELEPVYTKRKNQALTALTALTIATETLVWTKAYMPTVRENHAAKWAGTNNKDSHEIQSFICIHLCEPWLGCSQIHSTMHTNPSFHSLPIVYTLMIDTSIILCLCIDAHSTWKMSHKTCTMRAPHCSPIHRHKRRSRRGRKNTKTPQQ